jgi:putative ABC transport system ATP-binding protein
VDDKQGIVNRKSKIVNGEAMLIQLKQLVKEYDSLAGKVTALKGIDLAVSRGEFVVVVGKSGAGKTTLVNMIAGLTRHTAGEIWVNGIPVHQLSLEQAAKWRGQNVGVVFQSFELLPTLTVLQNVTLPMDFAGRFVEQDRRERALGLLAQVDIAQHAGKRPAAVSGGQQQRVAIARALANDPPLIIADEPTGSLDSNTTTAVLDLFAQLVADGKTVLMVTHDKDIQKRATRVVELVDGRLMD